jgi:hypothetical protein
MAKTKNQTIESKAVNETRCRLGRGKKKRCQNEGISRDVDDNKWAKKLTWVKFPLSAWMFKIKSHLFQLTWDVIETNGDRRCA